MSMHTLTAPHILLQPIPLFRSLLVTVCLTASTFLGSTTSEHGCSYWPAQARRKELILTHQHRGCGMLKALSGRPHISLLLPHLPRIARGTWGTWGGGPEGSTATHSGSGDTNVPTDLLDTAPCQGCSLQQNTPSPAACRDDHMKMEEAIAQPAGAAAFSHAFLETGGASSVFFQLPVNQSP